MYSLIWWSVMWRPGKVWSLVHETNQTLDPVAYDRQTGSEKPAAGVDCRRSGYALPPSARPRRILILIDAALSS